MRAAELMQESITLLRESRLGKGTFVDIENDPNETGLVGSPFSLITTDEGDLDSKLTTLDPNFSAVIVDLLYTLDLERQDTVAVLATGSMPGANISLNRMQCSRISSCDNSKRRSIAVGGKSG